MPTKVAVIIPTLNEELFIEACLQSVFAQTYPQDALDIMIIDGGSRDQTCEYVSQIRQDHNNVRLIDNPQRIQSVAFNIGVRSSNAPIVIRLDAHATYNNNYIELCVRHLENKEYGNVGGRWNIVHQHNSLMSKANAILNQMKFGIGNADFRVSFKEADVDTVPFGAFRREIINQIGLMNHNLPRGEDNEYNARIRAAGYKIHFDPNIISTYYARNTFSSSVKQMFTNGLSIGILLRCYRKAVGIRHLIPCLFTISLFILIPLSFLFDRFLMLLLLEFSLYSILNIISCLTESKKRSWRYMLILPFLIFAVHISYGLGTIKGIFKGNY